MDSMKWEIIKSCYPLLSKWLKVRMDHVRMPSGHEMEDFYVIESSDWVNVIAITDDNHFVLEKQYRHGIQKVCYETPAGCVDAGEDPMVAAKRELFEETGFGSGSWEYFSYTAPNASGMNNYAHTFIARGVSKIAQPYTEASEDIEVVIVSKKELLALLESHCIIEADLVAALYQYLYEYER